MKRFITCVAACATLCATTLPAVAAQEDRLAYVLTMARRAPKTELPTIDVAFGKSVPADLFSSCPSDAPPDGTTSHWLVRSKPHPTETVPNPPATELPVTKVKVDCDSGAVKLEFAKTETTSLDPVTHLVHLTYLRANDPSVTLDEPEKVGSKARWIGPKSADDANIYFSGKIAGAKGTETSYGAEFRLKQRWSIGRAGELGGKFEFAGEALQNGDPDTMLFGLDYERIKTIGYGGVILRATPIGLEMDREKSTRNRVHAVEAKFILPSVRIWKRSPASLSLLTGTEFGKNHKNVLEPDGGGDFWRWKLGVSGAFHTPLSDDFGLSISALWQRRFLTTEELYVETDNGEEVPSLTDKARNHLAVDVTINFTEALGIALEYRDGSLPPRFEVVKKSLATSLVLKLKRTK